jgi:hypothetical protein
MFSSFADHNPSTFSNSIPELVSFGKRCSSGLSFKRAIVVNLEKHLSQDGLLGKVARANRPYRKM